MISKEDQEKLLSGVIGVARSDENFRKRLLSALHVEMAKDIVRIKDAICINKEPSIDYSYIQDKRVRDRLNTDNLIMTNSLLKTNITDEERYAVFCSHAFFQIETLLNYFYKSYYADETIAQRTIYSYCDQYNKNKTNWNGTLSEIQISAKISAFCNMFRVYYPLDTPKKSGGNFSSREATLTNIKTIRNKDVHRLPDEEKYDKIREYTTYDIITDNLFHLYSIVVYSLDNKG